MSKRFHALFMPWAWLDQEEYLVQPEMPDSLLYKS
jgi:hypothetical protein